MLTLEFGSPRKFDNVVTREDLLEGQQRIAKYKIDAKVDDQWKVIVEGQTVGHKRIDQVEPITATAIRFSCTESLSRPIAVRCLAVYNTESRRRLSAAGQHTRLDNSRYNDYYVGRMKERLPSENKQRRAPCPEEAVFLDLLRTTDMLSRGLVRVLKSEDLSTTQYNVLRILRGTLEGLPCGEIASRMITRDPDITRLLDRLEKRGLISRCRETRDRRMVMARITPEGLKLLARLDEPVEETHRRQLSHLGRERLRALTGLLNAARAEVA